MRRFLLLISLLPAAASHAEETTERSSSVAIPLSEVIGLGQRGLRVLEPDLLVYRDTPEKIDKFSTPEGVKEARRLAAKSLVIPIERSMSDRKATSTSSAGPGFVVAGQGRDALQGIYQVLVKGQQPTGVFQDGTELSAVFYSLESGAGIRLSSAERDRNHINIKYAMIPHGLRVQQWQLAIIPLGILEPATYHVRIIRDEAKEQEIVEPGSSIIGEQAEKGVVCESFEFEVRSSQ